MIMIIINCVPIRFYCIHLTWSECTQDTHTHTHSASVRLRRFIVALAVVVTAVKACVWVCACVGVAFVCLSKSVYWIYVYGAQRWNGGGGVKGVQGARTGINTDDENPLCKCDHRIYIIYSYILKFLHMWVLCVSAFSELVLITTR